MKKITVKISIVTLILLAIIIIPKLSNNKIDKQNNQPSNLISKRETAIEKTISSGSLWEQEYKKFNNSRKFIVVGYGSDYRNHPEEKEMSLRSRAGTIVFEVLSSQLNKIWESSDPMDGIGDPSVVFDDLDSDGDYEILVKFIQSRHNENLYIYRYNLKLNNFHLISPIESQLGGGYISGLYGDLGGIKLDDIDRDGVKEITVTNSLNIEDVSKPIVKEKRIYKFNGQEYYLWKEEKVNQ